MRRVRSSPVLRNLEQNTGALTVRKSKSYVEISITRERLIDKLSRLLFHSLSAFCARNLSRISRFCSLQRTPKIFGLEHDEHSDGRYENISHFRDP